MKTEIETELDGSIITIIKLFAGIGLVGIALGVIVQIPQIGACGVARRTFDADNIIFNYEQFHDVAEQHKAQLAHIDTHRGLIETAMAEQDRDELRRLRMELAALESSCRTLASEYNADSQKINRTLFKSNNLPHKLDLIACKGTTP